MIRRIDEHTYEVTLYTRKHFWSGRSPRKVVISSTFPVVEAGEPVYAHTGDSNSAQGDELWPMLLEKAYATVEGSYKSIEGGFATKAFDLLLAGGGREFDTSDFTPDELGENIAAALHAHRPVTTGTGVSRGADYFDDLRAKHPSLPDWFFDRHIQKGDDMGIEYRHEYSISLVDMQVRRLRVQDPHGRSSFSLTFEDYQDVFTSFTVGVP